MKKTIWGLLCALALCLGCLSAGAEATTLEGMDEVLGVVYGRSAEFELEASERFGEDRLIYISTAYASFWATVPDESPDLGDFFNTGVRVRFDESSFDDASPFAEGVHILEGLVRPVSVEIVCELLTGIVVGATDSHVTVIPAIDSVFGKAGESVDIAIDESTLGRTGDYPQTHAFGDFTGFFPPNMGCTIIYDAQTLVALEIMESNG